MAHEEAINYLEDWKKELERQVDEFPEDTEPMLEECISAIKILKDYDKKKE